MGGIPGNNESLTSICPRSIKPLLFASKGHKLDVLVEAKALAADSASDGQDTSGTRTIVISAWGSEASKATSTIVVSTNDNSVVGLLDSIVPAKRSACQDSSYSDRG